MVTWNYRYEEESEINFREEQNNSSGNFEILNFDYKIVGDKNKLAAVFDDGEKTILKFNALPQRLPSVFVNQVGANDCTIFDGISSVFNNKGELIARAKAYEEQFMIVNPYNNVGKIYPLPNGFELSLSDKKTFSLDYDYDLERVYKALVLGVKDYFKKCGLKRAVLGLSGGLDSSVCAVILADALGKKNVYGISMPSHITSRESKSDAEQLANNLGIHFAEAPIRDIKSKCLGMTGIQNHLPLIIFRLVQELRICGV